MALPTTPPIDVANFHHKAPPFQSVAGNTYALGVGEGALHDELRMIKSVDPTVDANWTEQDASNNPDEAGGLETRALSAVQDGDLIRIVTMIRDDSGHTTVWNVEYHEFDMDGDTWDITNEAVISGINSQDEACDLSIRTNGDAVIAYMMAASAVMGNDFVRVGVKVRTGVTTYGSEIALGIPSGGDTEYYWHISSCVIGLSNRVHFFLGGKDDAGGSSVFSVAHISLSSSDVLDTMDEFDGPSTAVRPDFGYAMSFDDGGTVRVKVPRELIVDGLVLLDSGANPTITQEAMQDEDDMFAKGSQFSSLGVAQGVVMRRPSNGDLHLLYVDATFGGNDRDLFSSVNTGSGWAADVQEETVANPGIFNLSAAIYDRGGDTVIAYLREEPQDVTEYNEIILPASVADLVPEIHGRRRVHHRLSPIAA